MKYRIKRSDSIYHHGILGMKWGRRNGPPYPLSVEAYSNSERKRSKFVKKRIKEEQRKHEKSIKRNSRKFTELYRTYQQKEFNNNANQIRRLESNREKYNKYVGKLSDIAEEKAASEYRKRYGEEPPSHNPNKGYYVKSTGKNLDELRAKTKKRDSSDFSSFEAFDDYLEKFNNQYSRQVVDAVLKDLDLENTPKGREYVKKYFIGERTRGY